MQKNKQLGFMIEESSSSQLSFNLIRNINEYVTENQDDFVVFFENSTANVINPEFSFMSLSEIWNFQGHLFATTISTAMSLKKCFATEQKYFYVWDLEWTRRHGRNFESTIQAFTDTTIKLIARSNEHAVAIKNNCNRDVDGIVSDFNIEKLMRITNE